MNTEIRHAKGCNCKKSNCLKKYCECYQAGIKCTDLCKCDSCKNNEGATITKKKKGNPFQEYNQYSEQKIEISNFQANSFTFGYNEIFENNLKDQMKYEESQESLQSFNENKNNISKRETFQRNLNFKKVK